MKHHILPIALGAFITLAGAERAIAGSYTLDFLINPYHPGVVDSWFFDINNQGQATGYISERVGGVTRTNGVIYQNGISQILPRIIGRDINNVGEVVGNRDDEPYFFGTDRSATPITVPGSGFLNNAFASLTGGLNDSGNTLIGFYPEGPLALPTGGFAGLAFWNRQQGATVLTAVDALYPYVNPPDPNDFNSGPSSSSYSSTGTRINHANQFAAGIHRSDYDPVDPSNPDDDTYGDHYTGAYIYNGIGGYALLQNPVPGAELRPINIDEIGTVFGWAGDRLALWGLDGVFQTFLPDPSEPLVPNGLFASYPSAQRNDLGQIVAVSLDRGLLFYDPVMNTWTDITSSIDGWEPGVRFTTVQGFNEQGQFVGLARPPQGGGDFGYVVSPVPEPGTLSLLLAGALGLCGRQTAKRSESGSRSKDSAKPVARSARETRM